MNDRQSNKMKLGGSLRSSGARVTDRALRWQITQWGLLVLGGILVFGLAVYGWLSTASAHGEVLGFSELLSRSIDTLMGSEYIILDRSPIPPSNALGYASIGAKILLGLVAVKGTILVFGNAIRRWWWWFSRTRGMAKLLRFFGFPSKRHTVVCGAGERGDALARRLLARGEKVAIIEIDGSNEKLGELRELGAHIVQGNAHDATILKAAALPSAKRLVAVTSKDETNLAVCREATAMSSCEARAGVESFELRSYFADRLPVGPRGGFIRLESFQCRAARQLMLGIANDLAASPEVRQRGVRLLLEAADPFREEIVRAAAVMLQISGDRKPVLEICGADAEDRRCFDQRFPAAGLVAEFRWHEGNSEDVFPENFPEKPDAAVFALATDVATLERAERFRLRHDISAERILALVGSTSELLDLAVGANGNKKKKSVVVRNLFGLGLGTEDPMDPDIERFAEICHRVYVRNEIETRKECRYPEEWAKLDERTRESNRLAAMHHEVKRIAWNNRGDVAGPQMLVHLAPCEHMRWMAEKAMDGWRWSGSKDEGSRNDDLLRHHLLVPYSCLSLPEKDKDLNSFVWALGIPDPELRSLGLDEKALRMVQIAKEFQRGG